jgi:hypothetical protein
MDAHAGALPLSIRFWSVLGIHSFMPMNGRAAGRLACKAHWEGPSSTLCLSHRDLAAAGVPNVLYQEKCPHEPAIHL